MQPRSLTNRRTTLRTAAAALGVAGTGLGALALGTDRTRAAVTATLALDGTRYASATGDIFSPWIVCGGDWHFLIGQPASKWQVALQLSSDGVDWQRVATDGGPVDGQKASGAYRCKARVIDHDGFDAATFDAAIGEVNETTVYGRTIFRALDAADATIIEARAADSLTVGVENTTGEASAGLNSTGETLVQVNESDAEPTVTGG